LSFYNQPHGAAFTLRQLTRRAVEIDVTPFLDAGGICVASDEWLATHNPVIAESCDWIYEMRTGRIIATRARGSG
jgi:hypothetical protein